MPEFDCFITVDEYANVLATAFANGFRLCLKKKLLAPKHEYVSNESAIPTLIEAKQYSFFLERDDFTRCPAELLTITRDGQRIWFPSVTGGGPVIETYFWRPYTKEGARFVPCSLVAYGSKFFNPSTWRQEPAGEAAKKAYGTIITPLRKSFRRVQSTQRKRTAYVSPDVDAMLDAGWMLAGPFTRSPSQR